MRRARFNLEAIKRAATVPSVLAAHGVSPARRGCCPIHGGDNRSAFACDDERWHCFTQCGGGDVIALVQRLRGCTFVEATTWLSVFVGLTLPGEVDALVVDTFPNIEPDARAAMLGEIAKEWHLKLDELDDLHEQLDWLDLRWKQARGSTTATVAAFMQALAKERPDQPAEVAHA